MPYAKYHVAILTPADKYNTFRKKRITKGIYFNFGVLKDVKKLELHSIWFEASIYSVKEAKTWLVKHNYKPTSFEPSTDLNGMWFKQSEN